MSEKVLHSTRIELLPAPPARIGAGAPLTSRIRLVCPFGCKLKGQSISRVGADGEILSSHVLAFHRSGGSESDTVEFRAPSDSAEWTLKLAFDGTEGDPADHAPSDAEFKFEVWEFGEVTLAAWAFPAEIFAGAPLRFKVGAKSSSDADLAGARIEVRDPEGSPIGDGLLGTDDVAKMGLYSVWVDTTAPATPGRVTWLVNLASRSLPKSHAVEPFRVGFVARPAPDSIVRVRVLDEHSQKAVPDAGVKLTRIGDSVPMSFSGRTDDSGLSELRVPAGRYVAHVWRPDYRATSAETEIDGEIDLEIRAPHKPRKKREEIWM
jgi:hypothetical protein